MLPSNLEDWLTEQGDKIVREAAENGFEVLTSPERLLYELWLFDTEQRNGGVSQYFCNRSINQWDSLCELARFLLPSFAPFAAEVNQIVARSADPYQAIISSAINLDAHYEDC